MANDDVNKASKRPSNANHTQHRHSRATQTPDPQGTGSPNRQSGYSASGDTTAYTRMHASHQKDEIDLGATLPGGHQAEDVTAMTQFHNPHTPQRKQPSATPRMDLTNKQTQSTRTATSTHSTAAQRHAYATEGSAAIRGQSHSAASQDVYRSAESTTNKRNAHSPSRSDVTQYGRRNTPDTGDDATAYTRMNPGSHQADSQRGDATQYGRGRGAQSQSSYHNSAAGDHTQATQMRPASYNPNQGDAASQHPSSYPGPDMSHPYSRDNSNAHLGISNPDISQPINPSIPGALPSTENFNRNASSAQDNGGNNRAGTSAARTNIVLKNRFMLESTLGVGGMGIVYKAKDLRKIEARDRNPYIAIKILNEEFKRFPQAFIALQREAKKSQSIAHPNIVNVYDFDRDGETVFMTMEFLDGLPLDKLLRQYKGQGLPLSRVIEITKGMCAALDHAHAENVIHADFKPGNIFVTNSGVTKVFDFGIARAVANVDRKLHQLNHTQFNTEALKNMGAKAQAIQEKSIFDPDTFGALTPTYASAEMLMGQTPTTQDDIYALGCVVYEMLAGEHPFKRIHADQAMTRKMKPKRIKALSRQQWDALKRALAFKREDRCTTVHEFLWDFTTTRKSHWKKWLAAVTLLVVGATGYTQFIYEKPLSPEELRAQIERQTEIDFYKKDIASLIEDGDFSDFWQTRLWMEIQDGRKLLGMEDKWLIKTEADILEQYVQKIYLLRNRRKFSEAQLLFGWAKNYRGNVSALDIERISLEKAIESQSLKEKLAEERRLAELKRKKELAAKRAKEERERKSKLAQLEKKKKVSKPAAPAVKEKELSEKDVYALALQNVKQQLRCTGDINTRNFTASIKKLGTINKAKYQLEQPTIISGLALCIERIGQTNSDRAEDLKTYAMRLYPGEPALARIKITPKDPCSTNKAGLGARGKSGTCHDRLFSGGYGPRLVVVPKGEGVSKPFAIGQYEVSVGEFNEFCTQSKLCTPNTSVNPEWPITNVSYDQAKQYTQWLSNNTRYRYRIPRYKQWLHAANGGNSSLDDNRNCSIQARGISKGDRLEAIRTGRKNRWGLVNHVGNAQEWVLFQNRDLMAAGGHHKDPIKQCQVDTKRSHSGDPDTKTGFRVLRIIP